MLGNLKQFKLQMEVHKRVTGDLLYLPYNCNPKVQILMSPSTGKEAKLQNDKTIFPLSRK